MSTKRTFTMFLFGMTGAVLAMPAATQACEFLDRLCGRSQNNVVAQTSYAPAYYAPTAATYVPATSAASCVSCASPVTSCTPQSCYYVPQTCYKQLDRPILTALFGPRYVPVTTYRLECSSCYTPTVSYASFAGCPTGTCGSVAPAAPAVSSGCCGSAFSPTLTPEPAPYVAPQSESSPNVVPQTFGPADQKPSLSPSEKQESLKPVPEEETRLDNTSGPRLIDPDNRTTSRPIQYAVYQVEKPAPAAAKLVDVQWKPASR